MTIAVIETKEEADRFSQILGQEAKKMMKSSPDGTLDLKNQTTYYLLMDRVKIRFRAWQMEQPDFDKSSASLQYRNDALVQSAYESSRRRYG
jgi:hypothetical protein